MQLVDRPGRPQCVDLGAAPHPVRVVPLKAQIPHHRGGAWRQLGAKRVRVGLVHRGAGLPRGDVVLVERARPHTGHRPFPDPGGIRAGFQRMATAIPAVEVADDRDRGRVRRPYGEMRPGRRALRGAHRVGSELLVRPEVSALAEVIDVLFRQQHGGSLASRVRLCWYRPNECGGRSGSCGAQRLAQRRAARLKCARRGRGRASGGAPPSRAADKHQRFARFAARLRALFEGLSRAHAGGLRFPGGDVRFHRPAEQIALHADRTAARE